MRLWRRAFNGADAAWQRRERATFEGGAALDTARRVCTTAAVLQAHLMDRERLDATESGEREE